MTDPGESGGFGWWSVVREYAEKGWRLVQVFAPGMAIYGIAKYYELIFEREREVADATP